VELLVLFDVDGTLFVSDDPLVGRATLDGIEAVYGLRLPDDAMSGVDHRGRTARRITHEILRAAGLDDARIVPGLDRWCAAASERYLALLAATDTSGWESPPGTAAALEELRGSARIALMTGNPEPIARARMERLGLTRLFPPGEGAFGCEGDERAELIALARERAGGWAAGQTVEVGDTPADVEGARVAGVLSVAVLWGRFDRDELAGADAFVESMSGLPDLLARLGE
jgi:phosphoglycolate phosphatase-like HAD superfamily hydrolase